MRIIIITLILLISNSWAQESSFLVGDIQEQPLESSEEVQITPAIDHYSFDSGALESSVASGQVLQAHEETSVYTYENQDSGPYRPKFGLGVNYRYLGNLNKVGIEKSLFKHVSASLFYGRFQGEYYGSGKDGIIPGLNHYALELNFYLNSQKRVFGNGPLLKLGTHYNTLDARVDAEKIEVDGQEVISKGEKKWGPTFGAFYFWQWKYVNLSIGMEYYTLGKLRSFVPLSTSLGFAF